jgi:NAD(P)-dependent dehydrogenase (short-subunit alcohol dehydrogenase family)
MNDPISVPGFPPQPAAPQPLAKEGRDRRVALVTGATRGIGQALAEALAAAGLEVLVGGRDRQRLDEQVASMRRRGWSATGVVLHLDDRDLLADELAAFASNLEQLDVLVLNAAAGGIRVRLDRYPSDLWQMVFQVNVHACHSLLSACHACLASSAAGRVLFLSSGVARRPKPNAGAYAASKAALDTLAAVYALETAGTAIRSNVINPGPTRTGMRASAFPDEDPADVKPVADLLPVLLTLLADRPEVPHGRLLDADELIASGVGALGLPADQWHARHAGR